MPDIQKIFLIIIGIILILIVAFQCFQQVENNKYQDIVPVTKSLFINTIESSGIIRPNESVNITSTISDRIAEIFFEDGDKVKKDQILITLKKDEEESLLMEAQAILDEQELKYKRIKNLLKRQAASQAQAEEEERLLKIAKAKLANIQAKLRDYIIKAPFDGVLGIRRVSPGAVVDKNTILTNLDDISSVKIDFNIPEPYLPILSCGMTIRAETKIYPKKIFKGIVTMINSRVDSDSKTVSLCAVVPNPEYILKPGMFMTVNLVTKQNLSLKVPKKALIIKNDKTFVMVMDNKLKKTKRQVITGRVQKNEVEIISGLKENEKVIVGF